MEIKELRKAAESGDAEAQGLLGTALAMGEGVEQDLAEAVRWLKSAAEQGDVNSLFNLGIIHERGLGVDRDLEEAALWFWQAAEMGDAGAKVKLGTMLIKGDGFSSESGVVEVVRASADRGVPYAQAFLAKLYLDGTGMEPDDLLAEKWFRRAAEQGDESAMFNLCEMLLEDRTRETAEEEAAGWFYEFGMSCLGRNDLVKAFDCLVSIKRVAPDHFLAQRLEDEIERRNQSQGGR